MLTVQNTFTVRGKFLGGLQSANRLGFNSWPRLPIGGGISTKSSFPDGYRLDEAVAYAISNGGMSCRIQGFLSTLDSNIGASGNLSITINGVSSIPSANLAGGVNLLSSITGSGNLSSLDMRGKARLSCTISIGASPSAEDIAQAVWNFQVQGNTSPGNTAEYIKKTLKRDEYLGLS